MDKLPGEIFTFFQGHKPLAARVQKGAQPQTGNV